MWQEAKATNDSTWDGSKMIQGKYISRSSEVGPNKSMMYVLEANGERTGIWGSTVLDSKFQEIPVGSMVRVTPLGMAKGKSGKEYKDFKVEYQALSQPIQQDVILPDDVDLPPIESYDL